MKFDQTRFNTAKVGYSDSLGSLPIGEGDCGANVWVSDDNRINLLLSKTDSISEAIILCKLGLLQVYFDEPVFSADNLPVAALHLEDGTVVISDEKKTVSVTVAAFIDKALFGLRFEMAHEMGIHASVINYRNKKRLIGKGHQAARTLNGAPYDVYESADVVLTDIPDRLSWYHHNDWSYYGNIIRNQHLTNVKRKDPILNRTFGCSVAGKGFAVSGDEIISEKTAYAELYISAGCEFSEDPVLWSHEQGSRLNDNLKDYVFEDLLSANAAWWGEYFGHYFVDIYGDSDAETITRCYTLQKYMNGCSGRGKLPVKFNGSIFTVEPSKNEPEDYDFRLWGASYWIQNTRLVYWNMLYSGYYEGLLSYFNMLTDVMPESAERSRVLYGHEGLLQPETFTFFGTYEEVDFGYGQENDEHPQCYNHFIRWHYNGGLENSYMMLKFREYTGDLYRDYFEEKLLPYINGILLFFKEHFPKENGKMVMKPVSALETWQDCMNDTPDIAGLNAVIREMKKLGYDTCLDFDDIPAIPFGEKNGRKIIKACEETFYPSQQNCENGELYPLFPFDIYRYDMSAEDHEVLSATFDTVPNRHVVGWSQMNIWAAMLGNSGFCSENILSNFTTNKDSKYFFDAYFGPNFDWTPDQDHGNSTSIAVIYMLLQSFDDRTFIKPALPSKWKANFRLPSSAGDVEYED